MKSLRSKFLLVSVLGILLSSALIGVFVLMIVGTALSDTSAEKINLMCEKEQERMDSLLGEIEFSVTVAAYQAENLIDDPETFLNSRSEMLSFSAAMERTMLNTLRNTDAQSFYLYVNTDVISKSFGVYWSRVTESTFHSVVPPALESLDPENPADIWWFEPVRAKTALWVGPYSARDGHRLLTYCVPVYCGEQLLGVLGMDFNLHLLEDELRPISFFHSGYALLLDKDNSVVYHKDYPYGSSITDDLSNPDELYALLEKEGTGSRLMTYSYRGTEKCFAYRRLDNGMKLILSAPVSERNETRNQMILAVLVTSISMTVICAVIVLAILRRVIGPLKELTEASKKIAMEDLDVKLTYYGKDEVGILSDSFRTTVTYLKRYMSRMSGFAYRDSMTGVKNKRAYEEAAAKIDELISEGCPEFAVVVLDVNDLKETNDKYGHSQGDELIRQISDSVSCVFKHSPVFRIGGDEFVTILERGDYECRDELIVQLDEEVRGRNEANRFPFTVSAAKGMAVFDPQTDTSFEQVFSRADNEMYADKKKVKAALRKERKQKQEGS
ncbi:MAG: diguanylate cyclase [Clostridia bacterium]|nr:diguanylate cyclase [Clostridia bacterium]